MNIGSLYKVKKYFWLLFPTKETATAAMYRRRLVGLHGVGAIGVALTASYWSKQLNCEVTYFLLDSYIVFLEEDGVFKKVLTIDGLVGWTFFVQSYNDCFEEVETEES
jgi:hypothetical protein